MQPCPAGEAWGSNCKGDFTKFCFPRGMAAQRTGENFVQSGAAFTLAGARAKPLETHQPRVPPNLIRGPACMGSFHRTENIAR